MSISSMSASRAASVSSPVSEWMPGAGDAGPSAGGMSTAIVPVVIGRGTEEEKEEEDAEEDACAAAV